MSICVPVLAGQGNQKEADRTSAAAAAFLFWLGLFFFVGIFVASFFVPDPNIRISLRFLAFAVGLSEVYFYLREVPATRRQFVMRSKEELIRSVIDCAAAIALCKFLGLYGLGIATCGSLVATAVFLWRSQKVPFQLRIDRSRLSGLMRQGIPFAITEASYELLRRTDVLAIALFAGPIAVGYYGVSILIMDFAMVLSKKGVSQLVSPHLLKEFGRTGSLADVTIFYEIPVRLFCYVLPPLLGAGTFLIDGFVRALLPQYIAGIGAAQLTLWSIFFVALHFSINSFFAAANMIPKIIRLSAVAIAISAAGQFAVMRAGFGIEGAAWCALATSASWACVELVVARMACGNSAGETAGFVASIYLPFAVCVALRALVGAVPLITAPPTEPVLRAGLLLLFYVPVFIGYEMKFSMLRTVRQSL
jgi:O-antigen/teichoic acid export membrane protein